MKVELNQTLNAFRELSNGAYGADDRVVVSGSKNVSGLQRLTVRQVGGKTQAQQNNSVRTMLLRALRDQFSSGIPESVRRALVGSGRYGASDMREKNETVTSGRPLTMRRIRAVIQAVEVEIGEAQARERKALDGNLRSGLCAGDTKVADEGSLGKLLAKLGTDAYVGRLLQDETKVSLQAKRQALLEAQDKCKQARAGLKGLSGKDLADDVGGARNRLAAAVAAEADLAEKIASFTSEIRKSPEKVRTETTDELLGQLDDLAMSTEINAARIERLGAELMELKDDKAIDRLSPELEALVSGAALSKTERTEAQDAIELYVKSAEPLLKEIAQLETLSPNAATAEIAGRLGEALDSAESALADLANSKGVDPEAVRQLRANLTAARETLTVCGGKIREQLLDGMSRELKQMLEDCRGILNGEALKNSKRGPAFLQYVGVLKNLMKTDWLPKLEIGTAEEREAVFKAVKDEIEQGDNDPDKSRVLQRVGLTKFLDKYAAWQALLRDASRDAPFSRISAKLLAQALRGEIDVVNYLSLKTAGYTDEMFWADLVVKPGAQKESVGRGTFNEVHKQDMTNVRTGATETVVLKDVELTGAMSKNSVGSYFSSDEQVSKTDKINVATSKAATLIGCGHQITRCGMVRVGDRYQLAQEMAPGDTVLNAVQDQTHVFEMPDPDHRGQRKTVSFAEGFGTLTQAAKDKLKVELQLAAAKLEWADLLTGQIDRSRRNMMIKFDVTGEGDDARVEVVLKGIDNDIGFTEGQTGVFTFDVLYGKGSKFLKKATYNARKNDDQGSLLSSGVHGLRLPAFLPLSVKKRLEALDEATFRREMRGLLGKNALDAAVGRLKELKKLARKMEKDGRVVDDIDRTKTSDAKTLSRFVRQNTWFDNPDLHACLGNIYAEFLIN